jgi:lysophospholipase L1-like esterase
MPLRITGFGACMIAGYPLSAETGFLDKAVQYLRDAQELEVELEIVTMGGFPVDRAQNHFAKRVLVTRPEVVVLQFGSIDASAPLHRGFGVRHLLKKRVQLNQIFNRELKVRERDRLQPPTPLDVIKWQLRNLGGEILCVPSITPLNRYLPAILRMVKECRAAGAVVVVLSPFVMGGGRSNRFARRYTRALEHHLPKDPGVYFLDAHRVLSRGRRADVLLRDGFHLSAPGHQRLGVALGELLGNVVQERCLEPEWEGKAEGI